MNEKQFFDCIRIGNYIRLQNIFNKSKSTVHYIMKKLKTEGTIVYKARLKRKLTEKEESYHLQSEETNFCKNVRNSR